MWMGEGGGGGGVGGVGWWGGWWGVGGGGEGLVYLFGEIPRYINYLYYYYYYLLVQVLALTLRPSWKQMVWGFFKVDVHFS